MQKISEKDKTILRRLASRQLEHARSDRNVKLKKEWMEHNTFCGKRPMIHLELLTFQDEVIPPLLECEGEEARQIERSLYMQFVNAEFIGDDYPVPDYYPLTWDPYLRIFGHQPKRIHAENSSGNNLAYIYEAIIHDLEEDKNKLGKTEYGLDKAASLAKEAKLNDLFGDILPVRRVMNSLAVSPTQLVVHLMDMETMYTSMYDHPDLFHDMMSRIADDVVSFFKWQEHESLLLPTAGCEILIQGSFCFTDELPVVLPDSRPLRTDEVWGYLDSQETVAISPKMFGEFIFPYYKRIAECYGLLSYACCEPVHTIWDEYISKLSNLRKISISSWCDEVMMGERLCGKKIVYHRKPTPNIISFGTTLDEAALTDHIKTTLQAAKGCFIEFAQRDVYTIKGDISRARRYVEVIRETIDSF